MTILGIVTLGFWHSASSVVLAAAVGSHTEHHSRIATETGGQVVCASLIIIGNQIQENQDNILWVGSDVETLTFMTNQVLDIIDKYDQLLFR